jgi:hypothetical protein
MSRGVRLLVAAALAAAPTLAALVSGDPTCVSETIREHR